MKKTREEKPKLQWRTKRIQMERLERWVGKGGDRQVQMVDTPEGWWRWREPIYRELASL